MVTELEARIAQIEALWVVVFRSIANLGGLVLISYDAAFMMHDPIVVRLMIGGIATGMMGSAISGAASTVILAIKGGKPPNGSK